MYDPVLGAQAPSAPVLCRFGDLTGSTSRNCLLVTPLYKAVYKSLALHVSDCLERLDRTRQGEGMIACGPTASRWTLTSLSRG